MAIPRTTMSDLYAQAARIAAPGSASRLFAPIVDGVNHLGGHLLGGLRCFQVCPATPTSLTVNGSFKCHRHPNCDHLFVWVDVQPVTEGQSAVLTMKAGSGASVPVDVADEGILEFVVPWGASDTGFQEVTITTSYCGVKAIAIWDLPRLTLGSGDHRLELVDSTYPLGGFREGDYLIDSAEAGMEGVVDQVEYSWDDFHPQAIAWWTPTNPLEVDATDWTNPFKAGAGLSGYDYPSRHQARQKRTETTRDYRCDGFTWCAATVTGYEFRLRSNGDTVTSGSLSNTTGAWQTPLTGLAVDTTDDDDLVFEMRRTGGTGKLYVGRLSSGQE